MSRTWMTIVIAAACALITGFLVFGGANIGK